MISVVINGRKKKQTGKKLVACKSCRTQSYITCGPKKLFRRISGKRVSSKIK